MQSKKLSYPPLPDALKAEVIEKPHVNTASLNHDKDGSPDDQHILCGFKIRILIFRLAIAVFLTSLDTAIVATVSYYNM
jgi:hypothetical protein